MKNFKLIIILITAIFSSLTFGQTRSIFPLGEKAKNIHHQGDVWLHEISIADRVFDDNIAVATFDKNARLNWHKHPGGQIIMVLSGEGFYQEKGQEKIVLFKGDVKKCLPNVEHWHGATPDSEFVYMASSPSQNGKTEWLEPVADDLYSLKVNTDTPPSINQSEVLLALSKTKWLWMAEKNTDLLQNLFHENAVFVHMGGTMSKEQEINIIKSGVIQYKQADILESSVKILGTTGILLNRIKLTAIVGGNEVINPFVVTEVYSFENSNWTLGSMSFTKLLTP